MKWEMPKFSHTPKRFWQIDRHTSCFNSVSGDYKFHNSATLRTGLKKSEANKELDRIEQEALKKVKNKNHVMRTSKDDLHVILHDKRLHFTIS